MRMKSGLKLVFKVLMLIFVLFALCAGGKATRYGRHVIAYSGMVMATAYNSMESQTDSSPWITASGTRCRSGVIASNFLPFGTKVVIEGFGDKLFVVEDRMNRRFNKRIDIWFKSYQDARNFGIRKIKYHVLKSA